jgi:HAE1 family hydrophobic/amphiphilic exporter-1
VIVLLGAILLVGIAVNNAIVLVDCVNRRRALYPTLEAAIVHASCERLRPIFMTTGTTILGLIPLTGVLAVLPGADSFPLGLGGGEAAELRAPMAVTVIFGLFSSTVLTLVIVPVIYRLFAGRSGGGLGGTDAGLRVEAPEATASGTARAGPADAPGAA